jgi:hypothetical protein
MSGEATIEANGKAARAMLEGFTRRAIQTSSARIVTVTGGWAGP